MMTRRNVSCLLALCAFSTAALADSGDLSTPPPHLEKRGAATQLIVEGRPFLVLAGETNNSSASSLDYMRPLWPKFVGAHFNTILAPVSWEALEPEEGKFNFSLVDGLIQDARHHRLHLVLLWFGTWKNMVSSYAPVWVRSNPTRFPWAEDAQGRNLPILSTFSEQTRNADARAFAALLRHIRAVDAEQQTVLMIQVENEVGVSGGARDWSPAARRAFAEPVPGELIEYMRKNRDTLIPEFAEHWQAAGAKVSGTWEEIFGSAGVANETFMTWNYARFIGAVKAAGKAEYPLPMFVNAALGRADGKPGTYPSGGPMPLFLDIWRAADPKLDMISPDIYALNFGDWCARYTQSGNPLFIPETRSDPANAFLAFGKHNAIGISPFGIDRMGDPDSPLSKAYATLAELAPLILEHQSKATLTSTIVDAENPKQSIPLGNYTLQVTLGVGRLDRVQAPTDPAPGGRVPPPPPARGYVLALALGGDEYLVAGSGALITFVPNSPDAATAAFASVEEGSYVEGRWIPGRRLNGDEIMLNYNFNELAERKQTGTGLRLAGAGPRVLRVKLFRYN